jgi:glycogen debranching enzyme
MALAPCLFTPAHAATALEAVRSELLGPNSLGVKTLSPAFHRFYVSYYNNSEDSADGMVAHGFSYHNGPEWLWLYGYYLMALKTFTGSDIRPLVVNHLDRLRQDSWMSLPELTNHDGEHCPDSSAAQAWSIATLQEALSS